MQAFIGIDDGNFDTKSQHTTNPNGYTEHSALPPMATDYLYYNGKYYLPNNNRFNYMEDKTLSDRGLILCLFGVAKELIYMANRRKGENLEEKIKQYDKIALGAGLPPSHWSLAKKKIEYYEKYLGNGIEFSYNGIPFRFEMNYCKLFPQNYAALITNANDEVIQAFDKYVGVDIGGGTMDIVKVVNNMPIAGETSTDNVGVIYMYQNIISDIKRDFNIELTSTDIEYILMKKPTVLDTKVKESVFYLVQKWVDEKIVDKLIQRGINFATTPTVFFGGGSLLLKPYIKKNPNIRNEHFLKNPVHANAIAYAVLLREKFEKENRG